MNKSNSKLSKNTIDYYLSIYEELKQGKGCIYLLHKKLPNPASYSKHSSIEIAKHYQLAAKSW